MGLDAPRTLKEKLAELKEGKEDHQHSPLLNKKANANNRPSSQNSISVISEKQPQLGENTIEMTAIEKLQEEKVAQENN